MNHVRIGIIGVGVMGSHHARYLQEDKVPRATLTALCDTDPKKLKPWDNSLRKFTDSRKLIRSGDVDAVLIATPHYDHTTIGMDALRQGLHVLVEKPISVHKSDCERLLAAHKDPRQVFAAMFQLRTDPRYVKVREMVQGGELGRLQRVVWVITDWFRPEAYFASDSWRATWRGEGGGVLMNQCPHNLDLLQWICGMPRRVRAFCAFGKHHRIEVEDDVTAHLEFPDGATGVFITSTGEAPGVNRLELSGTCGKLVMDHGKVSFVRNAVPSDEFSRTSSQSFAKPDAQHIELPVRGAGDRHLVVTRNFVDAILDGAPLIAPAAEGIHSVELANAMLLSTWTNSTIELPLSGKVYEQHLKKRIASSKLQKKVRPAAVELSQSW